MIVDPPAPPAGRAPSAARPGLALLRHAPLAGILALAAALRFLALGRDGLWADEAFTAFWARLPLPDLLDQLKEDCHAPLSYLVAKLLLPLLGEGELQARLPSALLGVLGAALIYGVGRRIVSRQAGLLAAFLLATSPIHVHYSREARPYSLLGFLVILALLAAFELQRRSRSVLVIACAACLAMILYTHNIGLFFAAALLGSSLLGARGPLRRGHGEDPHAAPGGSPGTTRSQGGASLAAWLVVGGLTLAAYLPWLSVTLRQAGQADLVFAWAKPGWDDRFPWQLALSAATLTHGAPAPIRNEARLFPATAWLALALATLLVARGLFAARWRVAGAGRSLLLTGTASLAGIFAYSAFRTPIYVVGRVEPVVLPLFLILIAAGLASLGRRTGWLAATALALLAVAPLRGILETDHRSQEKLIAEFLASSMGRADALVVTGPFLVSQSYYLGRSRPDVRVRAFPTERERHPGWVDWSALSEGALALQADALVEDLRGASPAPGSIWLLLHPRQRNAEMAAGLARVSGAIETYATGYLGITLIKASMPDAGIRTRRPRSPDLSSHMVSCR